MFQLGTNLNISLSSGSSGDYVVNVLNCNNASVAYGFAISGNKKDDIVACSGREQPKACYMINIRFEPKGILIAKNGYLLGGLPFLAFVGFIFLRSAKPRKGLSDVQSASTFNLGRVFFDAKNRKLLINGNTIELTGTETRLLLIFASSPNETIARSRLQKEIWEDEGVIVGRSLDMFISKLRKKLELIQILTLLLFGARGISLK